MTQYYVDLVNGNDGNSGLSYLLRKKTLSSVASVTNPGDEVRIMQSYSASSLTQLQASYIPGVGVTLFDKMIWTNNSSTLTIPAGGSNYIGIIQVSECDAAGSGTDEWTTANPEVTVTVNNSDYREGSSSIQFALSSSYNPLAGGGTMAETSTSCISPDAFSCNVVSFWFKYNNASFDPTLMELSVQSSSYGTNTQPFPTMAYPVNKWIAVVIEFPNLSTSTDPLNLFFRGGTASTATTILIDNVVATQHDGITHNCLVSKGTTGESWYCVRALLQQSIVLDMNPSISPSTAFKYQGSTQYLPLYYRRPIQPDASTSTYQTFSDSGTLASPITLSGGWDSAGMTTQVDHTFIDGSVGSGNGLSISGSFVTLDKIGISRFNQNLLNAGNSLGGNYYAVHAADTNSYHSGVYTSPSLRVLGAQGANYGVFSDCAQFMATDLLNCDYNLVRNFELASSNKFFNVTGTIQARGRGDCTARTGTGGFLGDVYVANHNTTPFIMLNTKPTTVRSLTTLNNGAYGGSIGGNELTILNLSSSGNTNNTVFNFADPGYQANYVIQNPTYTETNLITTPTDYQNASVCVQNKNGTLNNNIIYSDGATVTVDTSDPNTPGGLDYTISITSTNRYYGYPFIFEVPPGFAVNAGSQVDLTLNIKLSSANIYAKFVVPGGQIPGVPDDVYEDVSGTGYNPYTLSFTPTQKGVIRAYVWVWTLTSTTDYVRIADVDIDQA